ncbi:DUF3304 domain-containing protein [Pseudomonas sp. GCM10022186]|uniref:DUF3304 domain-containing protein n=1 Tax=Pseudomonas sp. GCM10022186 TaxID=3252650 RepID=UPI00360C1DDA
MKRLASPLALLGLCLQLAACDNRQDMVPAALTGIDHLADHLSVQDFSVNGTGGFQAGKGGSVVCCVSLPRKWHPGLTAVVSWNTTNWRDCAWEQRTRRVPVEHYDEVGHIWTHFLADSSVRVVSSDIGPGIYGPNPDYPGPYDLIPQKEPWKVYPAPSTHCPPQAQPTVMERLE